MCRLEALQLRSQHHRYVLRSQSAISWLTSFFLYWPTSPRKSFMPIWMFILRPLATKNFLSHGWVRDKFQFSEPHKIDGCDFFIVLCNIFKNSRLFLRSTQYDKFLEIKLYVIKIILLDSLLLEQSCFSTT